MSHTDILGFVVPDGASGLIIGESARENPEIELRRREIVKLEFPAWVTDPKALSTASPILANFYRALVLETLGVPTEDLPRMKAMLPKIEGTDPRKRAGALPSEIKAHNGKELRRLLVVADHVVRRFFPSAATSVGGSSSVRGLRDMREIRTAHGLIEAERVFRELGEASAQSLAGKEPSEDQFLLVNALSFAGLYVTGLLQLLRTLQEALLRERPADGIPQEGMGYTLNPRPAATVADVVEVDGKMVYDLLQYAFTVYSAARVLAEHSLGGIAARQEVDRMGLACMADLMAV